MKVFHVEDNKMTPCYVREQLDDGIHKMQYKVQYPDQGDEKVVRGDELQLGQYLDLPPAGSTPRASRSSSPRASEPYVLDLTLDMPTNLAQLKLAELKRRVKDIHREMYAAPKEAKLKLLNQQFLYEEELIRRGDDLAFMYKLKKR